MLIQNGSQMIYSNPNSSHMIMQNGPNQQMIKSPNGIYLKNGMQKMFIPNNDKNNINNRGYNYNLFNSNNYMNYNNINIPNNIQDYNYNEPIRESERNPIEDIRSRRISYFNSHYQNNQNINENENNPERNRNNNNLNNSSHNNIINNNYNNQENEEEDDWGICPITGNYMEHPVITTYGHYYEKSAILDWLRNHDTDPMTNQKLTQEMIFDDIDYENAIKEYKFIHNIN